MATPTASMGALSSALQSLAITLPRSRRRTTTTLLSQLQQARHESTTRRMTKALRLHPHASFIGTASTIPSKSTHAPLTTPSRTTATPTPAIPTIIYNPPSAAPTPSITPRLFIPATDPRFSPPSTTAILKTAPTSPDAVPPPARPLILDGNGNPTDKKLPPSLTRPYAKTYHLSEADVKKIQRLRASNPNVWSRRKLADKFGCSEFFVGMVAPVTKERVKEMKGRTEKVKERWGKVRTFAREARTRRRQLWGKDL
ncbi:54S ribosomal protein L20 [Drechslerella dactyloides]|uniref:54S ribosomal protein L20 n=1 Tax=Drechslerella dactyloides TaxID=74499 RepID=A0AAD6NH28_DREDA|nr:54S ribosomal protein L20 [Drechslerella dactyloides]